MTYNPGLTGSFSGTYRINAIYRDQWSSVSPGGQYSTPNLSVDLPIIRGIRKQDWIGIGVNMYRDASFNDLALVTFRSAQSVAYHFAFDENQNNVLSLGVQQITGRRSVRNPNLITEDVLLSGSSNTTSIEFNNLQAEPRTMNDWAVGLSFLSYFNKNSFFNGGIMVDRLLRQDQGVLSSSAADRQNLKFVVFGIYDTPINRSLFIRPQFLYQRTGKQQELVLQTKLSYLFKPELNLYLNGGLGYRVGDAVQVLLGADYKDWKFGISYDINANRFVPATNTFGSIELAVGYVGKIYKKPKVKPTIICPRL